MRPTRDDLLLNEQGCAFVLDGDVILPGIVQGNTERQKPDRHCGLQFIVRWICRRKGARQLERATGVVDGCFGVTSGLHYVGKVIVTVGKLFAVADIARSGSDKLFVQARCFTMTIDCVWYIEGHQPNFCISGGDLALEGKIIARFLRETVEVFERPANNQLPSGERAGQIADRVVQLEHKRIGNLPKVIETTFRPGPFFLRDLRLASGGHDTCQQDDEDEHSGRGSEFVPLNQLRSAIDGAIFAGGYRPLFQIPPNVTGERSHAGVTARRFLPQRLEDDVVQIAAETALRDWIRGGGTWAHRLFMGYDAQQL